MKSTTMTLFLALLLLLLQAHADYLYQASLWEWWTWIDLTSRAPHWPWYADWIPHDAWHIVQTVRNHAALIGAAFAYEAAQRLYCKYVSCRPGWQLTAASLAGMLVAYALTRAVGFTLVYELMN